MVTTNGVAVLFERLQERVAGLCGDFETIAAAEEECLGHEVKVLALVLDTIKPVVKYIDEQVVVSGRGYNDHNDEWYLDERGVELVERPEFARYNNIADGATMSGESLVLVRSGALNLFEWDGSASGWRSEGYHFGAQVTKVTRATAIQHFGPAAILEGPKGCFEKALAKADERCASLQKRLDLVARALPPEEAKSTASW